MTDERAEEWRWIPGYRGIYSVSDKGRVQVHMRVVQRDHTKPYMARGRVLARYRGNAFGHWAVDLWRDGRKEKRYIHHLVAEQFILPIVGKPLVLHGPGGVDDNRVENLRWGTQSENELDKARWPGRRTP